MPVSVLRVRRIGWVTLAALLGLAAWMGWRRLRQETSKTHGSQSPVASMSASVPAETRGHGEEPLPRKETPAKQETVKAAATKKGPAKKGPAKKGAAKRPVKKAPARESSGKKTAAKKMAKGSPAKGKSEGSPSGS